MKQNPVFVVLAAFFVSIFLTATPFAANALTCEAAFSDTAPARAFQRAREARDFERTHETRFAELRAAERIGLRSPKGITSLRVATFNVKNLYMSVGKYLRTGPNRLTKKTDGNLKPEHELLGIKKAIQEINADILVLQEVENLQGLNDFARDYLNDRYEALLIEGNDPRGIDIGFLVKKDLPLSFTLKTNKHVKWEDPADNGASVPLFSRDLPALEVRRNATDPDPILVVIGNHGKSKRDRDGDPESNKLRTAQYEAAAKIIANDYEGRYGKTLPVLLAGDFNTNLQNSPETAPLKKLMTDPFDILKVAGLDRATHTYHPSGGARELGQLDGILVNVAMAPYVLSAVVYRYTDENGNVIPLPKTYQEREKNPSDHFPFYIDVSTALIFPEAHDARAAGF